MRALLYVYRYIDIVCSACGLWLVVFSCCRLGLLVGLPLVCFPARVAHAVRACAVVCCYMVYSCYNAL